jgi:soluble lytic murein transglycosylase
MPRLHVVLDDPRLAGARERVRAHDPSGAARALDAARAGSTVDAPTACAWAYLAGRLHQQAGDNDAAIAAFEQAAGSADAGPPCTLAPYAAVHQAQVLVSAGRHDQAIARLSPLPDDAALRDDAQLALADAYVGKGDRASAVPIWRALLSAAPHGLRWADSSVQLAGALLDGVDGPAASRAQEALDLATRVLVESPAVADRIDLAALRTRAAVALHLRGAPPLTPDERARQAQAWLDQSQQKRAGDVAKALLDALPIRDARYREASCKAAVVVAQAEPRGKHAADHWGVAIERCAGQDALATALYYGGKASASAHRDDEALQRFGRVEKEFPAHRLADDARVRAAQIVREQGDVGRSLTMLASVADSYPDGDMRGEALFRVAIEKLVEHDLDAARATLDRLLTMPSDDRAAGSPGRAAYFRARVSQLSGDVADARARYQALVEGQALSFYMLLAYERLHAIDADAARSTVDRAVARETAGSFLTTVHPELATPAFDRFQRLLEVGELDDARHEASVGGLVADGVDPQVLWTLAWA